MSQYPSQFLAEGVDDHNVNTTSRSGALQVLLVHGQFREETDDWNLLGLVLGNEKLVCQRALRSRVRFENLSAEWDGGSDNQWTTLQVEGTRCGSDSLLISYLLHEATEECACFKFVAQCIVTNS